jgi:hypothetical protein
VIHGFMLRKLQLNIRVIGGRKIPTVGMVISTLVSFVIWWIDMHSGG